MLHISCPLVVKNTVVVVDGCCCDEQIYHVWLKETSIPSTQNLAISTQEVGHGTDDWEKC